VSHIATKRCVGVEIQIGTRSYPGNVNVAQLGSFLENGD